MNCELGRQFAIAACVYLGQIIVGISMGWTAPIISKLQNIEETPLDRVISDAEASWVVSITFVGTLTGPYISGYLGNVIGRKPCLFLGGTMFLVCFVIFGFTVHISMIYIGRIVSGIGCGILFVTNLVYLGELASTKIRGTLLTLTGFSNTFGILIVYSIAPFVSYAWTNWISAMLCVLYLAGIFFIVPETATYQVMAGNKEEAMAILTSLGRKGDIDDVVAAANEKPMSNFEQLTEMFTLKTNRKALFIIIVLNICQQASGVMAIISFVTLIFELTGSNIEAHISTIIIGVTQVFAASIAPVLVDRSGRRILLLVSTAACSISLVALGTYFYMYNTDHPAVDSIQWLSLVSLMLYFIAYFSGFGIIPNTFIGEMFTDNCRSFASTFTVTVGWLFGFAVSSTFGYILAAWGPAVVFWIYAVACAFTFFFSVVFVPETKGKSFLEIQKMLGGK
ncbi:facilitated trehalose transporter Tret1 [Helicoverpa armigera]|uniref:facilitated trehalose transporter Tret1 n=1 Tax=Helicoverpa armigera TaxID=29058 RepID=UPI003083C6F9